MNSQLPLHTFLSEAGSASQIPSSTVLQQLPSLLAGLLERIYLTSETLSDWQLDTSKGDTARPLLREVTRLGRPSSDMEWASAMPYTLTACHNFGHALMMVLHSEGEQQCLYLGGRRLLGEGGCSTEDYLKGQESAFKAYFSGLQLGVPCPLDDQGIPALTAHLQTAPLLAAMTGIPSPRRGDLPIDLQSIDRLVQAVGSQRYSLMVIAEPMDTHHIETTLDLCRRLKSEIHGYVRQSRSAGTSHSESQSHTKQEEVGTTTDLLPGILAGVAMFASIVGILVPGGTALGAGIRSLAGLSQPLMGMATMTRMQQGQERHAQAQQITHGQSWSENQTHELLDAHAEACESLLAQTIARLETGRSFGWWRTAIYIAAETEAAMQSVAGAVRSLCSGQTSRQDPIRLLPLPAHRVRTAFEWGQILTLHLKQGELGHPLGEAYNALATCIQSEELAVLINLPRQELARAPVRDQSAFALAVPPPTSHALELGKVLNVQGRSVSPLTVLLETLNRHVFITGMPGFGKTNTCMHLLHEAWRIHNIPFLVIEPAKAEYQMLASISPLNSLRRYVLGTLEGHPLRINPLQPVRNIPLSRHIDLLKAVFNASFSMFAGMSYVLDDALREVYTERGWSLHTSQNRFLTPQSTRDESACLMPCLEDLYEKIEIILKRKGYGQEIHQNMGAALRSRIGSLMQGGKGLVLNTRRSTPPEEIFGMPAVIELQNLGDDEEKAFVMAIVFVMLYEYAQSRQSELPTSLQEKLQHLTLIEEAHRLLTATRGAYNPEIGDPRGKAVSMFTDMLAEMRAFGEGFLVADQIPTKLAPEIIKNTNLKIVHRLASEDDRHVSGRSMNLTDRQILHLNTLEKGQAVVHDERIGEAVMIRVHSLKEHLVLRTASTGTVPEMQATLMRHSGCRRCSAPCTFAPLWSERPAAVSLREAAFPFWEAVRWEDAETAWQRWQHWNTQLMEEMTSEDMTMRQGLTYCAVMQSAFDFIGKQLAENRVSEGKTPGELTPQDHLTRERAIAVLPSLMVGLLSASELSTELRERFVQAQSALNHQIHARAPYPECAECPQPCRMGSLIRRTLPGHDKDVRTIL